MARKRKRRGDAAATEAPVEEAGREAPEAAANSATRRRGGDATAEQEASGAVHAPGPVDSGKETTDREGKKPSLSEGKRSKTDQSPRAPASDADAAATGKSGDDCTHGVAVLGDAEVCMNPRNADDPDRPDVNIGEKGTPKRKKPNRKKRKKNMQQGSPSAVSDDSAVEVDKSRTDCKGVEDVPGNDETIRSARIGEDPGFSSVKIAEQEIQAIGDAEVCINPMNGEKSTLVRKKPKRQQRKKNNMQQLSPSAVSDDNAVEVDKSRTECKDVEDVPVGDETIRCPRNEEDPGFSAVKIAEQEIPEMKKPRLRKRKNNKQTQSPSAVTDGDTVVVSTVHDCTHAKGAPGVADVSLSSRNGEDQDCPEVNIAEKETPERKKPKLKKPKENKQERSPAAVSDDGAVQSHKFGNVCIDGDDASGDAQVSMRTRNVEDPYCPEVNIAEKGTNERKKHKPKKRKNKKGGSSSAVLDAGAVVADESRNGCTDGDSVPQDIEASICPRNGEDPDCPVHNSQKGIPEIYKPKRKKRKKNNQEQSPSNVLDAGDVVVDKSGHDSTNVGTPSVRADVTMSPRIGEGPEYPKLNATEDLLEGNKVNKDHSQKSKKRMKNKHELSPSAVLDTCAVVEDKSGMSYIDGKGSVGDTEISTSPRNGKDHDCPEVNIANGLVEGNNGNKDNSQKPKNKKRKRKKRTQVAVAEIPPVGDVCSDESKVVCRTEGNHKENVQDIYSPEGSLVRFQRKKLLILDLNGILADINTDRNVLHMADGRIRGKNVFKRPYLDDFLRFCFQNFELGIWSSRMKFNVDAVVDILMKDLRRHLVFCWDASTCTTTKCSTLENNSKPLVLKELKKLWNSEYPDLPWEQGEFSPSNTLLVDDSPYKALRNPPYTAIFPQSYSYHNAEDKSLGPGGDLRVYLENIAAADDVQRYVKEHPFGQPAITERDPDWDFYARIHNRLDRL